MIKFIRWFAGFFEDQKGAASSKRGVLYICLFFLWMLVKDAIATHQAVDSNVLFLVGGLILFCVGAVTTEFFAASVFKTNVKEKSDEQK